MIGLIAGYRRALADYRRFRDDLGPEPDDRIDRERFLAALRARQWSRARALLAEARARIEAEFSLVRMVSRYEDLWSGL